MAKRKRNIIREFISEENRDFRIKLGSTIASSLTGLICGIVIASILWIVALYYVSDIVKEIVLR